MPKTKKPLNRSKDLLDRSFQKMPEIDKLWHYVNELILVLGFHEQYPGRLKEFKGAEKFLKKFAQEGDTFRQVQLRLGQERRVMALSRELSKLYKNFVTQQLPRTAQYKVLDKYFSEHFFWLDINKRDIENLTISTKVNSSLLKGQKDTDLAGMKSLAVMKVGMIFGVTKSIAYSFQTEHQQTEGRMGLHYRDYADGEQLKKLVKKRLLAFAFERPK